jgi:hypothetical protein
VRARECARECARLREMCAMTRCGGGVEGPNWGGIGGGRMVDGEQSPQWTR